jgi:hypothetical protein
VTADFVVEAGVYCPPADHGITCAFNPVVARAELKSLNSALSP